MGARGPQPKPSYLRVVEGNPGGRPFNPLEAKVPLVKELPCPAWFNAPRQRLWKAVCHELASMGGLSSADYQMLVLYVDTLAETERLMQKMQELPDSVMKVRGYDKEGKPFVKGVRSLAWYPQLLNQKRMALIFATHFGQTPSARARIVTLGNNGDAAKDDPFAC